MQGQSNHDPGAIDVWAEHLVVLDIVGISAGRTRSQIDASLALVDRPRLDAAIATLERAGVLSIRGEMVVQSPALDRLDRLDMICI